MMMTTLDERATSPNGDDGCLDWLNFTIECERAKVRGTSTMKTGDGDSPKIGERLRLTYPASDAHDESVFDVIVTARFTDDHSFNVTDGHVPEWTVYPAEITMGRVCVESRD